MMTDKLFDELLDAEVRRTVGLYTSEKRSTLYAYVLVACDVAGSMAITHEFEIKHVVDIVSFLRRTAKRTAGVSPSNEPTAIFVMMAGVAVGTEPNKPIKVAILQGVTNDARTNMAVFAAEWDEDFRLYLTPIHIKHTVDHNLQTNNVLRYLEFFKEYDKHRGGVGIKTEYAVSK